MKTAKEGNRQYNLPGITLPQGGTINLGGIRKEEDGKEAARFLQECYKEEKERITSERYRDSESQKYFRNPSPRITTAFVKCLEKSLYPEKNGLVLLY